MCSEPNTTDLKCRTVVTVNDDEQWLPSEWVQITRM